MADYLVRDTELEEIADAIRQKGGTSAQLMFPTEFVTAIGNISGGGTELQSKTVNYTPSEAGTTATITPDSGYDGLSSVKVSVAAVASDYVGSDITRRSSTDLTASGATVSAPAGYYSTAASKAVATGSVTIGTQSVTINPTVSITTSGEIRSVVSGSTTITPTVSAGYVSSVNAGTITVSGSSSSQLTTKGATTYTPTTTNQTISSGTYLTGNQTISGDANLVAGNIKNGTTIFGVTGTYSGGGGGTPILGALRPDAELVKRWSYNKLMVQDEGETLPSYTTTQTSLVGSSLLETVSIDETSYCYVVLQRTLSYPVYSSSVTKGKGRAVFHTYVGAYEMVTIPPITISVDGATSAAPAYSVSSITRGHNAYFSAASTITFGQNNSGVYLTLRSPSYQSGSISVYSPYAYIKGNTTYFTQTYWNFMTDAKVEYIIELYRAPKTPINGWAVTSQLSHAFSCFSNGGTLT